MMESKSTHELTLSGNEADSTNASEAKPSPSDNEALAQPTPPPEADEQTGENKNAEFDKLIKGEFKQQYEERIKNTMDKRFKESSHLRSELAKKDEIISKLAARYGIDSQNPEKLIEAIENDTTYFNEEAEKNDMNPESLRRLKELEYENASMKREMQAQKDDLKMKKTLSSWLADSEELSKDHPDFSLEKEASNPAFLKLLRGGADLKTAYYALHHKEILDMMVENAREEAMRQITQNIRARGSRPVENGLSQKSTALFKTDVSKLTPAQRAEIARRVASGEEISF